MLQQGSLRAQETDPILISRVDGDTLAPVLLKEVTVAARRSLNNNYQDKSLNMVEYYLEESGAVSMIKRGRYAWEPMVNNMSSERLVVTIDGMQIFGACTDKMDPVTSYVDVSNLENVGVHSGQEAASRGHSTGGGIGMELARGDFSGSGLKSVLDSGFETNGNYSTLGLDLEYKGEEFYTNIDGSYRNSGNYQAGNGEEIPFSQFEKYNISAQAGLKITDNQRLETQLIYDRATDVGYPALPMDVALAEAFIGSVFHTYQDQEGLLQSLQTRIYFNTITHIMDDSARPDVPIRMDMPGWSDTFGFFSEGALEMSKHHVSFNINGFHNRSLAEMTMFPNDANQPDMFMYTWPDIRTLYSGIYVSDAITVNETQKVTLSARMGYHSNRIAEKTGVESLRIFHEEVPPQWSRFLKSLNAEYSFSHNALRLTAGGSYGERAPSVTEGYGFFLYNSFDNYDYIGNPKLPNEKALEAKLGVEKRFNDLRIGVKTSWFHINDYVIGEIDPNANAMTIGANGVRVYRAMPYADILNSYADFSYEISKRWKLKAVLGYNYGKGSNGENLPLINPVSYNVQLAYKTSQFNAAVQWSGNGQQTAYSPFYGEDLTPAYQVLNLMLGNAINFDSSRIVFKYGVENILDRRYSTFADWNNVLRPGRNFFVNASYIIF